MFKKLKAWVGNNREGIKTTAKNVAMGGIGFVIGVVIRGCVANSLFKRNTGIDLKKPYTYRINDTDKVKDYTSASLRECTEDNMQRVAKNIQVSYDEDRVNSLILLQKK